MCKYIAYKERLGKICGRNIEINEDIPIDLAYTLGICGRRHSASALPCAPAAASPPLAVAPSRAFDLRFEPDTLLLELLLELLLVLLLVVVLELLPEPPTVISLLPSLPILPPPTESNRSAAQTVRIGAARQL